MIGHVIAVLIGIYIGWLMFSRPSDYSGPGLFTSKDESWW